MSLKPAKKLKSKKSKVSSKWLDAPIVRRMVPLHGYRSGGGCHVIRKSIEGR